MTVGTVSPPQAEGIWRVSLGHPASSKPKGMGSTQHTGKAGDVEKPLKPLSRKTRVTWQKLDCLKSNPRWSNRRPIATAANSSDSLCRELSSGSLHLRRLYQRTMRPNKG